MHRRLHTLYQNHNNFVIRVCTFLHMVWW
jgi:hypothetical protein